MTTDANEESSMDDPQPNPSRAMPAAMRGRTAPQTIKDALKAQLSLVLEKELTPKMLMELSQTAELAHKMLIVAGEPRAMRKMRQAGTGMMGGGYGAPGVIDVVGPDDDVDMFGGGMGPYDPLAPAPFGANENFGAQSLRNLVADANKPKLSELMRSLEIAQKLRDAAPDGEDKDKKSAWIEALQAQIDEALAHGTLGDGGSPFDVAVTGAES